MKYINMIGILAFIFSFCFSQILFAEENFDSPDSNFESKMFDINSRFNSEPTAESEWLNVLGSRRSETYKIQTGDNLWEISRTFFGDGKYWPKLWSENSNIQNPHQILPRRQIQFLAGTTAEAPVFNVIPEKVADAPAAPTYVLPDVQDDDVIDPLEPRVINGKPVIPKAANKSAPVLKNLPPSFKTQTPPAYGEYDATGLDVSALASRNVSKTNQLIPFFVMQEVPEGVGVVTEMELGDKFAGNSQVIFIKMNSAVNIGDKFTTFAFAGNLSNDEISRGKILEVGGTIKVTELVDADDNVYKASVVEAINPIRATSVVTRMNLPTVNFALDRPVSSTHATVVGGEFNRVRRVVGLGSVIYLRAESTPLTVGEVLTVESIRKTRVANTQYPSVKKPVALVKVANVDGDLATASIINSIEEVSMGDITGGPAPKFENVSAKSTQPIEIKNSTAN